MSKSKKLRASEAPANGPSIHPKSFVFCDRGTGIPCFEVNAKLDGGMPVEQATSLLALHCVVRHQRPRDFSVMIALGEDLVDGLAAPADKLIQTCVAPVPSSTLSQRQQEVLTRVEHGLTNKEIAGQLSLSERTIKFHVSALLDKFSVRGRSELVIMATDPRFLPRTQTRKLVPEPLPLAEQGNGQKGQNPTLASPMAISEKRTSSQ
jgi:DNA-binding CsgD family transcriptional regulator